MYLIWTYFPFQVSLTISSMQLLQPTALTMSSYSTDIEMGQHRVHFLSDKWLPYFQSVVYDFSTFGFYLFMSLPLKSAWASRVFATAVRCSLPPSLPRTETGVGIALCGRTPALSVRPSVLLWAAAAAVDLGGWCWLPPNVAPIHSLLTPVLYFAKFGLTAR